MKIFVVGSGKLANALVTSNELFQSSEIIRWETHYKNVQEKAIFVHAGSGRQLQDCFEFCKRTKSVFIELSTGLETETMIPDFPLIICPNTSILLLKTMHMLKAYGRNFANYEIEITESHQASKTTEPGTAYAFANALLFPHNKIVSIREPEVQQQIIGIPQEFLEKHAYHKIIIKDGSDEVIVETKVLGHNSYAKGVNSIVDVVLKHCLENKKYTIFDFIDCNML